MTYQANPVDTGRPGPHHADVVDAVAADPAIDLVAVFGLLEPVIDLPQSAVTAIAAGRPVVVGLDGPAAAVRDARQAAQGIGVPVVVGAQALAGAVSAIVQDAGRPGPEYPPDSRPSIQSGAGPWNEAQAKDPLDRLRIPTPPRRLCHTRAEAHAALASLGTPVVVKVCDAAIVHRSDVGGVHVGITDDVGLDAALAALTRLGDQPALVERMAPDG